MNGAVRGGLERSSGFDQFDELMRGLARSDSRMDARFAALEHRLTGIEQQLLQRIDELEETLKTLGRGEEVDR